MTSIHLLKPYMLENKFRILLGVICLIVVDLVQLYIPRVIKWAVDDLTVLQGSRQELLKYALYIIGMAIVIGAFRYVWRRCLIGTSRRVEEGLRNQLFNHVQKLSAPYFDVVTTGDLMAHATNDIQNIRMATGMGIVALTDAVVLGTAAIGFMFYIDVQLTLYVLIPMPFIVFGTRFFSKKLHGRYLSLQSAFSGLTEVVRERFAGIRMIKAHNMAHASTLKVAEYSKRYVQTNLRLVAITRSLFPMMVFLSNVSLAIILYQGGRETIRGVITPGDFVAFISYLGLLTWPMMAMGWVTNLIQRGKASLDRIAAILKVVPEIESPLPVAVGTSATKQPPAPVEKKHVAPSTDRTDVVVFENVSFSYPMTEEKDADADSPLTVLSCIDVAVGKGEILGVVGPPGSGKTTALSLIPRIYEVTGGSVRINGTDVRQMDLGQLRSGIAYVPQEPFLFAGTVRGNITFDNPDASESDLNRAVEQSSLTETIELFSRGFDTIVGEKGVILSGGQKQRIALARALLKDVSILVLDDPISQVDSETGDAIIQTIRSLAGKRTVVIVSHRLSAVRFADHIICLDKGHVVQSGNHESLMTEGGYYAGTFRLQATEAKYHAQ